MSTMRIEMTYEDVGLTQDQAANTGNGNGWMLFTGEMLHGHLYSEQSENFAGHTMRLGEAAISREVGMCDFYVAASGQNEHGYFFGISPFKKK